MIKKKNFLLLLSPYSQYLPVRHFVKRKRKKKKKTHNKERERERERERDISFILKRKERERERERFSRLYSTTISLASIACYYRMQHYLVQKQWWRRRRAFRHLAHWPMIGSSFWRAAVRRCHLLLRLLLRRLYGRVLYIYTSSATTIPYMCVLRRGRG